MKRMQIKELAQSVAVYGGISDNGMRWIADNFSRNELKMFALILSNELRDRKVIASFAGNISKTDKNRIISLFPDKNVEFKRDDENLGAGLKLEYGDFVLDCSVSGIVERVLGNIKENL
ncbi:MAG: hypothetical protein FWH43_02565 [Endomicrobia bacterium]|nr:hypothetical protein [Endomicrobiia bacterium]